MIKEQSLNVSHSGYHENYEEDPLDKYLEILNSIKELDGLSEDEIANLAAQQRLTHR